MQFLFELFPPIAHAFVDGVPKFGAHFAFRKPLHLADFDVWQIIIKHFAKIPFRNVI
jgi:hypothetical protein